MGIQGIDANNQSLWSEDELTDIADEEVERARRRGDAGDRRLHDAFGERSRALCVAQRASSRRIKVAVILNIGRVDAVLQPLLRPRRHSDTGRCRCWFAQASGVAPMYS